MTEDPKGKDDTDDTEGNNARRLKDAAVEADDTEGNSARRLKDAAVEADDTEGHVKYK
jgi:hypothetical protein